MKSFTVAALLAAALTTTTVAPVGSVEAAGPSDNPIDQARKASQTVKFTGVVVVHWRDQSGEHDERVAVESTDGALTVVGANALLWPTGIVTSAHPDPSAKYRLTPAAGATVAGRSTRVVEVRRDGALRERLYLDHATNLLMRREQFDRNGAVTRAVAFVELREGNDRGLAKASAATVMHAPTRTKARAVSGVAPPTLRDGFRRVGVYRQNGVVHLLYSDGMYQVSLFEQPGRLDRERVPGGGQPVPVNGVTGWHYSWAGGDVLLWQAGRAVYTLVGDAPIDDLTAVAASMPTTRRASLFGRVRSACRALLDGF